MVLNDTSQIQLLPAEPPPVDWSVNECGAAPTASCIESDSFNISTSHTLAAGRVCFLSPGLFCSLLTHQIEVFMIKARLWMSMRARLWFNSPSALRRVCVCVSLIGNANLARFNLINELIHCVFNCCWWCLSADVWSPEGTFSFFYNNQIICRIKLVSLLYETILMKFVPFIYYL